MTGAVPSPLWAVLAFTWVGSLGTGVVANGIYFLTKHGYGFSVTENYLLGLTSGAAYIAGALGAGWVLRVLRERFGLSTRGTLVCLLVAMGLLCLTPLAAVSAGEAGARASSWPIWVLMLLYQPMTGVLWPIMERYLSGGRSGVVLRSALGRWNITWSSALVAALWAMGPVEDHPQGVIAGLGVVHLLSVGLVWALGAEPGAHLEGEHEAHPASYAQLLATFRVLLPTSYVVLTALNPYLPTVLTRLGVDPSWQPPLGATWTAGRVITFVTLERWHGWHGKWWPAAVAVALLLGGSGAAVFSQHIGGDVGVAVCLAGLLAFGVGMAAIYTGSLYYAMECEREEVEAGSRHEALIGVGYTGGPACGLVAVFATHAGVVGAGGADALMLGMVGVIALGAAGGAGVRLARSRRREPGGASMGNKECG